MQVIQTREIKCTICSYRFERRTTDYLTLYLRPSTFLAIPDMTVFLRPTDPGIFTPTVLVEVQAPALSLAKIVTQKNAHDKEKR